MSSVTSLYVPRVYLLSMNRSILYLLHGVIDLPGLARHLASHWTLLGVANGSSVHHCKGSLIVSPRFVFGTGTASTLTGSPRLPFFK